MTANLDLNYYYGNEADQYNFYRIPKVLLTDSRYSGLSLGAKFLYGLLLDRMSLSMKNGWMDRGRRVYIYFTLEDAMEQINCGHTKAVKLFAELEQIGLIERKKQGQGRPTRIYVKNFVLSAVPDQTPPETPPEPPCTPPEPQEGRKETGTPSIEDQVSAPARESSTPDTPSCSLFQMGHGCLNAEVQTAQKEKSGAAGLLEIGSQDFQKAEVHIMKNDTELNDTEFLSNPYPPAPLNTPSPCRYRSKDKMEMDEIDRYRERIRENIDYDRLLEDYPGKAKIIDGYVELMAEACCTCREVIRISGNKLPSGVVKSRFLKLTYDHIVYVLDCMNENTTFIRNIKAYTMTALYYAPMTIQAYYAARVNHDLYGNAS